MTRVAKASVSGSELDENGKTILVIFFKLDKALGIVGARTVVSMAIPKIRSGDPTPSRQATATLPRAQEGAIALPNSACGGMLTY
jgi:hypothetical protein